MSILRALSDGKCFNPQSQAENCLEVHQIYAEVNLIQPRKDLVESDLFKNLPYTKVFMDDMARSKPVFLHENGYQFEQYIKQAIEAVMLSNEKSEVALADLRRNLQEVLDEE